MNRTLRKTKEDYNIIASHFSEKRRFIWGDLKPLLKFIKPDNKVLDAGCGNGRLYKELKRKKVDYLGIDFSKNLLSIAKKEHPKARFKLGDLSKDRAWNSLKDYDVACCIGVLHHFPTPEKQLRMLKHIYQALRPEGVVIISVWNLWQKRFWKLHFQQLAWKIIKGFKLKWLMVPYKVSNGKRIVKQVDRFCYAFSIKELEEILKKAGFNIIDKKFGRNLCLVGKKVVKY